MNLTSGGDAVMWHADVHGVMAADDGRSRTIWCLVFPALSGASLLPQWRLETG